MKFKWQRCGKAFPHDINLCVYPAIVIDGDKISNLAGWVRQQDNGLYSASGRAADGFYPNFIDIPSVRQAMRLLRRHISVRIVGGYIKLARTT